MTPVVLAMTPDRSSIRSMASGYVGTRTRSARSPARVTWRSRQVPGTDRRPAGRSVTPRRSPRGAALGQHAPEADELGSGAPERQLQLLGQQEVAVQRVVAIDADATVQVLRGVHRSLSSGGRPVLRHGHL